MHELLTLVTQKHRTNTHKTHEVHVHDLSENYKHSVDAHATQAEFPQSDLFRSASWTLADHNNSTLKMDYVFSVPWLSFFLFIVY